MYRTIIQFKKDTSVEELLELKEIAEKAFDNRAGKVSNVSLDLYTLIYQGGEEDRPCLDLGMLDLDDVPFFKDKVEKWDWIDEEDPDENCDVLEAFDLEKYRASL